MPRKLIPYLRWPVAFGIILAPLLVIWLWPMSYWFDVRMVHINDARIGEPITMLVQRDVRNSFTGRYGFTLHKWSSSGPVAFCKTSSGPWEYREGAVYPVPLTLAWWTEGACLNLPAGQYQATTRWTNVGNIWLLPEKSITVVSNIFTITP
jgi:hypothetical protein